MYLLLVTTSDAFGHEYEIHTTQEATKTTNTFATCECKSLCQINETTKNSTEKQKRNNNVTQPLPLQTCVYLFLPILCYNSSVAISKNKRDRNTKNISFFQFCLALVLYGFCFRFRCFCWIKFWISAWMRLVSVCCCAWQEERWQRKRSVYFKISFFYSRSFIACKRVIKDTYFVHCFSTIQREILEKKFHLLLFTCCSSYSTSHCFIPFFP